MTEGNEKNKQLPLPINRNEMRRRGWDDLDVLFISGDAYVDHPAFGLSLLARLLEVAGYRVGIIPQPDLTDPESLARMGRPRLFAAISAGAMDSMVNHYTAAKKIRSDDAYSPGGVAGKRPNRAVIAYTAAVKGVFKGLPTIIGGIEASLRRLAHYDYWSDKVRRSILVDSKADLLIYGMAESALLEVAKRLDQGASIKDLNDIRGTAYISARLPKDAVRLPDYATVLTDKKVYNRAFKLTFEQTNPWLAKPLVQNHDGRELVVMPPAFPLDTAALDHIYALPFTRQPHPSYTEPIPAYRQTRHSVTSHRGCFGGCAFCAIASHQGKTIQSRSRQSILDEIETITRQPDFHGTLSDVGGPTANMYGLFCNNPEQEKVCRRGSCLFPAICTHLSTDNRNNIELLRQIRSHAEINHVFIASGIRYDLLPRQQQYFDELLQQHIGGLLKVAPESFSARVTATMRKPATEVFTRFLEEFRSRSRTLGLRVGIVPYLISGHPGCTLDDMVDVALYLQRHNLQVEQVQDFTPTPGTLATCIYHTGRDPFSGKGVYVPRAPREKRLQKALLLYHRPESRQDIIEALRQCRREHHAELLIGNRLSHPAKSRRQRKPRRPGI